MVKHIIKSFIIVLALSTGHASEVDESYALFGNGIEGRIEVGKYEMFTAIHGNLIDNYIARAGAIYKFKEGNDWHLGIGGGIALTDGLVFDRIPARPGEITGYVEGDAENDILPFIQLEARKGVLFIETFYSNKTYNITRRRIVVEPEPGVPLVFETRNDSNSGPGFGVFVGIRVPMGN